MRNTLKLRLFALGLFSAVALQAQALPTPPATPVDGGLSLLLIGGVAYGAKKMIEKRK